MSKTDLSAGPLAGLRVLDLSTMLAGPYGATLLGDLGADVIKIESHQGDDSRHLGPMRGGECGPYLSLNRSKRDLVLDLRQDAAQQVFARVAATADILVTNVREPALSKLGLNYEQVKAHKPDIIWIRVTAFGPDGPYAGRPGIDFLAQGYAGVLTLNGEPEGNPVRTGFPAVDVITSLLVSNAALAALRARDQSGEGQRIEVSLLDALMHAQASSIGTYLATGDRPVRTGNRSLYFAPSGVYPTRDGKHVVITTPGERFFVKVCRALESDWDTDPRFHDIHARLANQDELDRVMAERTSQYDPGQVPGDIGEVGFGGGFHGGVRILRQSPCVLCPDILDCDMSGHIEAGTAVQRAPQNPKPILQRRTRCPISSRWPALLSIPSCSATPSAPPPCAPCSRTAP